MSEGDGLKLSASLWRWLQAVEPAARAAVACSWRHAQSAVWRVEAADAAVLGYVKEHAHGGKFLREESALRHYAAQLAGGPRLLAVHRQPPAALYLSAVPGVLQHRPETLDLPLLSRLHAAAGAWLAHLHHLPLVGETDPVPLAQALQQRGERALAGSVGLVAEASRQALAAALPQLASLDSVRRVPCHRDFQERNWLWDEAAGLGVIDFEHARADWWLLDCQRLQSGSWQLWPSLRQAFFTGYGRTPTPAESVAEQVLTGITALASIVWGHRHDDLAFESAGRRDWQRWWAAQAGRRPI